MGVGMGVGVGVGVGDGTGSFHRAENCSTGLDQLPS